MNSVPTPKFLFEPTFLPEPNEFVEKQVVGQPAGQVAENILDNLENNKYYTALVYIVRQKVKKAYISLNEFIAAHVMSRVLKDSDIDYGDFKKYNEMVSKEYLAIDVIDWLFGKIGVSEVEQFEVWFRAYKQSGYHKTISLGPIKNFASFLYNEEVAKRFISKLKKKSFTYEEIIEAFKKFAETDGYFTKS